MFSPDEIPGDEPENKVFFPSSREELDSMLSEWEEDDRLSKLAE